MDKRKLVIILSDIHMGIDTATDWYHKEVHEKYLIKILNDIVINANQIQEVILLGDIFEFWLYPPNQLPPTLDDIIDANPDILGFNGKLRQALSALKGRMVYLPGDHDMNITKFDLIKIRSTDGYTIKYYSNTYIPSYDTGILFTHGHELSLFNAPCFESPLAPLPIGYFVARAIAYKVHNLFTKKNGLTIADIEEYETHYLTNFLSNLPYFLISYRNYSDSISAFIDAIAYYTGIPNDMQIQISKATSVSLNDVKKIYKTLPWDKKNNLERKLIDIVVMSYSHSPSNSNRKDKINYVNTGFINQLLYEIYDLTNRSFSSVNVDNIISDSIQPYNNEPSVNNNSAKEVLKDKQFTFGWSVFDESLEFWSIMQDGVLSKAKELGINIIKHDEKSNPIEMITGSVDLIRKGVDALLIAPYNPEGLPFIVSEADKNQIPVVVLDIGTGGADVAAFIVSDSFGGGIYAGEYALTLIKKYSIKSTNVAIIKVQKTAKYALLRGQGFKGVMIENGYTIVAEVTANSIESQAYEAMKNILATYADDLAVVFCENGTMTLGAAQAIDEAGKKGEIMLIGFDSGPSIIAGIKNGSIQGTIAQEPFLMGELSVEVANSILLGIPVIYDDISEKIILMKVYLINENGEALMSIV
jgi:ribose transport system substrate-binding protein